MWVIDRFTHSTLVSILNFDLKIKDYWELQFLTLSKYFFNTLLLFSKNVDKIWHLKNYVKCLKKLIIIPKRLKIHTPKKIKLCIKLYYIALIWPPYLDSGCCSVVVDSSLTHDLWPQCQWPSFVLVIQKVNGGKDRDHSGAFPGPHSNHVTTKWSRHFIRDTETSTKK